MSDGGLTTVESGPFTVTTTSGISKDDLAKSLRGPDDKAASEAASRLGKRGGEASAKARAEGEAEPEKPSPGEGADKSAERQIKPIPPKVEAKPSPVDEQERRAEKEMAREAGVEEKPEGEGEPKPDEAKDKRGDPRHDPKARMLEATRKEAEAKRLLAEERRRNDELAARIEALERGERPQPKAAPETKKDDGRPVLDDFLAKHDTYEKGLEAYFDARDTYNREQWDKEIRQRSESQSVERALDQAVGRFRTAAAKVMDQISEEVGLLRTEFQLAPGEEPTGENWLANELVFSPEIAPTLMLHFTAHPEDLQRIAALSTPRAVSREMAKLEARLEAATTGDGSKREPAVSTAAPPVKPVTGKSYVSDGEWRPGMSVDEYRKVWEKQTRRKI